MQANLVFFAESQIHQQLLQLRICPLVTKFEN